MEFGSIPEVGSSPGQRGLQTISGAVGGKTPFVTDVRSGLLQVVFADLELVTKHIVKMTVRPTAAGLCIATNVFNESIRRDGLCSTLFK